MNVLGRMASYGNNKICGLTNNNANTANAMETDDSNSSANSGGNINSNDKTDGDNKAPIKKSKLS